MKPHTSKTALTLTTIATLSLLLTGCGEEPNKETIITTPPTTSDNNNGGNWMNETLGVQQDEAVKQTLAEIITAQEAYRTTNMGTTYAGGLEGTQTITSEIVGTLFDGTTLNNFRIYSNGQGTPSAQWFAIHKSGSGNWFGINNTTNHPTKITQTALTEAGITLTPENNLQSTTLTDTQAFTQLNNTITN